MVEDTREVMRRLRECPKVLWYGGDLLSDAIDLIERMEREREVVEWSRNKLFEAANLLRNNDGADPEQEKADVRRAQQILWTIVWPKIRHEVGHALDGES